MPNLPDSSVANDEAMFDRVLTDPQLQVDQWKIYPCSVVPWTVIEKWHREGKYVPYSDKALFDMLMRVKAKVHNAKCYRHIQACITVCLYACLLEVVVQHLCAHGRSALHVLAHHVV